LVRTLPCHGRGRGFESRRPRHSSRRSFAGLRPSAAGSPFAHACKMAQVRISPAVPVDLLFGAYRAHQKKPRISAGLVDCRQTIYLPVPVRLEVCGLLLALSLTLNVPGLVPVPVGVNVTLILQLDLAARLVVQVVVETVKSPVVEITMLPNVTLW
jgi:hypothetical protein